jgi:hypothetical protein
LRLDVSIYLDRSLLDAQFASRVQRLACDALPSWRGGALLRRSARDKVAVDLAAPGTLHDLITRVITRPGPFYEELATRHGRPRFERPLGSAEFRGPTPAVILVMHVDAYLVAPMETGFRWGNGITFQVCRSRVEGLPADEWARRTLRQMAEALAPAHAYAGRQEEYYAKNMDFSAGARALGWDISRFLPGLYWLNYFGAPYVDLIGRDKLATCPGASEVSGGGFVIGTAEKSGDWQSGACREREQQVLDRLGRRYFFDRNRTGQPTVGLCCRAGA